MSIKLLGRTLEEETVTLTEPSSMVITRAWNSPAVQLEFTVPYEQELPMLTDIQVTHDEDLLFAGYCDEIIHSSDGEGRFVSISARSPGSLLVDNEALPTTYTDLTAVGFFKAELSPLGFHTLTIPNTTATAATFQLNKGHSVWEAFTQLCFRLYGREPHINEDLSIAVEALTGENPYRICNDPEDTAAEHYCSLEYINRRSSALSSIVYRDSGGAYSNLYDNPFGNEMTVRRNRYVIPAAEFADAPALDPYQRFIHSQLGITTMRVTVPKLLNVWPGRGVFVKDAMCDGRLLAAYQVKIIYNSTGCRTRMVLADPLYM